MPIQKTNNIPNDSVSTGEDNTLVEQGIGIPWPSDRRASYVYYECMIGTMLDSGIVVHNRLPQVDRIADTLSSTTLDAADLDTITIAGVNLTSRDQYTDIVQRMGHSRYWFRIWGRAIRVGYQIPIPGIKLIGGVPAIPYDKNPQWAYNAIVPGGNYGGTVLWRAQWSLWYTTVTPPINQKIPAADPSAHISGNTKPPALIQAPYSQPEEKAAQAPAKPR